MWKERRREKPQTGPLVIRNGYLSQKGASETFFDATRSFSFLSTHTSQISKQTSKEQISTMSDIEKAGLQFTDVEQIPQVGIGATSSYSASLSPHAVLSPSPLTDILFGIPILIPSDCSWTKKHLRQWKDS